MAIPVHLTIPTDVVAKSEALLTDWRWLVPPSTTPILMTALGDLFLRDKAGHIHFLDLMCGELKEVATSQEQFEQLCDNRENRQNWFASHLVAELRKRHGELGAAQCFSCKIPLSLGGQMEPDNFQPCDIAVHYSVLGQLHQQTQQLPAGTIISDIHFESPDERRPKTFLDKIKGWMR